MEGIKASVAERGSLLEWRWTPFFALLTLALVASLITALLVPSTPAQLFATPEMTQRMGKRPGIPTQSGIGSTLAVDDSDDSNGQPQASTTTRRGSLQRLADRNRARRPRPAPPPRGTAEPVRREIPPAPEPEIGHLSNDREEEDEPTPADQPDEPLEEDEADPPGNGAGGAGQEADSEDEEGPPAPGTRPKLLNPGVLRTIPGLQR